jgi:hypothetical protein
MSTGIDVINLKIAIKQLEDANNDLISINEKMIAQRQELSGIKEKVIAQNIKLRNSLGKLLRHQKMLKDSEERFRLVAQGANGRFMDWDITSDQ